MRKSLFLCVLLFSGHLKAYEQIEMLWVPSANTVIPEIKMNFDDNKKDDVISVKTLGTFRTNYRKYRCYPDANVEFSGGEVDRVVYTAFPEKQTLAPGLELTIGQGYGSNVNTETHVPSGYTATYSSYRTSNTVVAKCPSGEHEQSSDIPISSTTINLPVSVNAQYAYPGVYTGKISGRVGLYENFCSGGCPDGTFGLDWFNVSSAFPVDIPYTVTITSKCSFNTSPVLLAHGDMRADQADGKDSKPYSLNVSCSRGTTVKLQLKGADSVSGKASNYTKCGSGSCEIKFDDGKYQKEELIDSNKTFNILSTYHSDNNKPLSPGAFSGSGVLSVLIN
ncbi:hypothetical protein LDH75_005102 [Escherichia coli]|nr:hypothetical protein [Escherichia coli]